LARLIVRSLSAVATVAADFTEEAVFMVVVVEDFMVAGSAAEDFTVEAGSTVVGFTEAGGFTEAAFGEEPSTADLGEAFAAMAFGTAVGAGADEVGVGEAGAGVGA
jgi:hypothetical protein